ncbi:unnamed protein product [Closterium sp. Yama58-4]|nr:unnamed protein product [Closterium sp. Yama58-4]
MSSDESRLREAVTAILEAGDLEELTEKKVLGDSGELVICELSGKRKLTVSEFKGRLLVSIREYYDKGGKEMPSSKGISLPPDQWDKLVRHIDTVQEAIDHLS